MKPTASISVLLSLVLAGCVGSPVHQTATYNTKQHAIKTNNANLFKLRVGMAEEDVRAVLGPPERSEGYQWGYGWLYRTAMTSGIYGTADSDFTPVIFDTQGKLIGWGRNFFETRATKEQIEIRHR